ncbi:MAG: hypothetical protein JRH13_05580 [Deltaproteobacteria bacterium]|nr:hypothetical protein [Deltaproteobacteria bacterium]MBW2016652.1 hypothetical protein [Deltaproteobacteria bacterium]MBW2128816.1 hypothetical protein [Deltaproteobacteria bacterium]MBW2303760.1 hypothetical protein [Deltaproteobacteria bacterium]
MEESKVPRGNPSPERLEAIRRLPKRVLDTLSREEIEAFLHDEVWPDSLKEKLKEYIVG